MTDRIITAIKNQVGHITLNHPEKSNAIDALMCNALIATYHEFQKNPAVKIIFLNANGKNFCTGADLQHMRDMGNAPLDKNLADAKQFANLFQTIYQCKKPTVCFAQGKIIGGGLGLLAANDICITSENATFCFSEIKLGLIPAVISPFVVQRIGYQNAKYFMLTADEFNSKKALEIKLIDHIDSNAESVINKLLLHPERAMQELKTWLNELHPISDLQLERAAKLLATLRCEII